jgi:hypothetical protein
VLKIGVETVFPDEIMAILVLPEHFPILPAFFQGGYFKNWDPIKSMRCAAGPGPRLILPRTPSFDMDLSMPERL